MNKVILLLAFLCAGTTAMAQDTLHAPSTITLQMGMAAPAGSYSSTSFDREHPAFAGMGSLLQLSYTHTVRPSLGLGATVGFRSNPFQEKSFAATDDALVQDIQSTAWKTAYALADVQWQLPFWEQHLFYVRGALGGAFNRAASLQVQTPYGNIIRPTTNSFTPAYGLSTGIQGILNRFVLGLEASLLATRAEVETRNAAGEPRKHTQAMRSTNFSLKLGYQLLGQKCALSLFFSL